MVQAATAQLHIRAHERLSIAEIANEGMEEGLIELNSVLTPAASPRTWRCPYRCNIFSNHKKEKESIFLAEKVDQELHK